ncbi:MAG: hypothetical protein AB7P33_14105 [Dehalococcoidia bacterium]
MASSAFWKVLSSVLAVVVLGVAVAAAAYFFWIKDDDEGGSNGGAVSSVQVSSVLFSNEIDSDGNPVNTRIALPAGSRAVRASVRLLNVQPGMTIEGKWFQLGPTDAGAEGIEISTSKVVLNADTISSSDVSRVQFSLGTNGPPLPEDAWLLRVYVNGQLVKTAGFVIGGSTPRNSTTTTPPPATSPTPAR